ncbi:DUF2913 family protein [Enterobacter kobei]|uniref:DUF2913 family protein n=1 Tax=Enterobacter kobei TaxID=208224 RepID=UPI002FD60414
MTAVAYKRPSDELAHLAWCIIVAVRLAGREGKICSPLQEHLFVMQWLATAIRRKLFSRTLAPDLAWLQAQGKQYGVNARLVSKIEYIWLSSSGEFTRQSTLFRFTCMIDTLRTMGWRDYLLTEKDWNSGWTAKGLVPTIYTPRERLHACFSESGELLQPLPLRFTGDAEGVFPLLAQCRLQTERLPDAGGCVMLSLQPES